MTIIMTGAADTLENSSSPRFHIPYFIRGLSSNERPDRLVRLSVAVVHQRQGFCAVCVCRGPEDEYFMEAGVHAKRETEVGRHSVKVAVSW